VIECQSRSVDTVAYVFVVAAVYQSVPVSTQLDFI